MEIGSIIKQRRKEAGLTQEALAKKVGCATITIRQYESGKREPNLSTLHDIANALNVGIFDLLPDDPNQDPYEGLSEDEKNCILSVSRENETLKAILTIFFQLPDDRKILFLKELRRLEKEAAEEEAHAVDPQEND